MTVWFVIRSVKQVNSVSMSVNHVSELDVICLSARDHPLSQHCRSDSLSVRSLLSEIISKSVGFLLYSCLSISYISPLISQSGWPVSGMVIQSVTVLSESVSL